MVPAARPEKRLARLDPASRAPMPADPTIRKSVIGQSAYRTRRNIQNAIGDIVPESATDGVA